MTKIIEDFLKTNVFAFATVIVSNFIFCEMSYYETFVPLKSLNETTGVSSQNCQLQFKWFVRTDMDITRNYNDTLRKCNLYGMQVLNIENLIKFYGFLFSQNDDQFRIWKPQVLTFFLSPEYNICYYVQVETLGKKNQFQTVKGFKFLRCTQGLSKDITHDVCVVQICVASSTFSTTNQNTWCKTSMTTPSIVNNATVIPFYVIFRKFLEQHVYYLVGLLAFLIPCTCIIFCIILRMKVKFRRLKQRLNRISPTTCDNFPTDLVCRRITDEIRSFNSRPSLAISQSPTFSYVSPNYVIPGGTIPYYKITNGNKTLKHQNVPFVRSEPYLL